MDPVLYRFISLSDTSIYTKVERIKQKIRRLLDPTNKLCQPMRHLEISNHQRDFSYMRPGDSTDSSDLFGAADLEEIIGRFSGSSLLGAYFLIEMYTPYMISNLAATSTMTSS